MPAESVGHRAPTLATARLTIRPFHADDIDDSYLGWLNDPVVTRFSNQRFHRHDRTSAAAYLRSFDSGPSLFLSLRRAADDVAIGTMTAHVAMQHATADMGLLIGNPAAWGQGYGLEAWSCVMRWLLGEGGMRKVTAGTAAPNRGMLAIIERSGMDLEGTRRAQEIIEGNPVDILLFGRFRNG